MREGSDATLVVTTSEKARPHPVEAGSPRFSSGGWRAPTQGAGAGREKKEVERQAVVEKEADRGKAPAHCSEVTTEETRCHG